MAKAYEIYQQTMSDITGWNDYIKFENIDYANTKAFEAIEEYYKKKDETYSDSESETKTKSNPVAGLDKIRFLLLEHINQMDNLIAKYEEMQKNDV
jgi:hypothetical protein